MPRDVRVGRQPQSVPRFPIGTNSNASILHELCPKRDYKACFSADLKVHYPVSDLFGATGWPKREDPSLSAAAHAARLFPTCGGEDFRSSSSDVADSPPAGEDGPTESFVSSALRGSTSIQVSMPPIAVAELRKRLREASRVAVARLSSSGSSSRRLRCASSSRALDERLLILIGIPTTAHERHGRRSAARTSWMRGEAYGRNIIACFLLSAHEDTTVVDELVTEHAEQGDLLLLDMPETKQIITANTKYSNFTRAGRGMPTFKQVATHRQASQICAKRRCKIQSAPRAYRHVDRHVALSARARPRCTQYAFFQHAAAMLPHVPYVGKIDDDTAPNLQALLEMSSRLLWCVQTLWFTQPCHAVL